MESYKPFDDFLGMPDCYDTLGVDPEASAEEIDLTYDGLVKCHLCTINGGDAPAAWRAEHLLDQLNAAYAVIGNPARRRLYDIWRRALRSHQRRSRVSVSSCEDDAGVDFSADSANLFLVLPSGRGWLSALFQPLLSRAGGSSSRFMGPLAKMLLLPIPFCLATMMAAFFSRLGELTNQQVLGDLTAIVAYPLILCASLLRIILPIRYRPLLSARQRLLSTPIILFATTVLGWLWVVGVDHAGATMNALDLYWWCGLLIATCATLAYF